MTQLSKQPTVAFIGGGHMAYHLVRGLVANGHEPDKLRVSNPSLEKLTRFEALSVATFQDNLIAAQQADIVVLAVKPAVVSTVCRQLAPCVAKHNPLVLSLAIGASVSLIEQWLGQPHVALVRTMPNIPASIGVGATGLYAKDNVTDQQKNRAESLLRAVGLTVWVEQEAQLDVVAALSGSGSAYIFYVMEALQTSAQSMGLPLEVAKVLTRQMTLGAARMALESDLTLRALRESVTSKGGSTAAALDAMQGLPACLDQAMRAARHRCQELEQSLTSDLKIQDI